MSPRSLSTVSIWILTLILLLASAGCGGTPAAAPTATAGPAASAESPAATASPEIAPVQAESSSPTVAPTPTEPPTPTPAPLPALSFEAGSRDEVTAGQPVASDDGIVVHIDADALEEGTSVALDRFDINPAWRQALERSYTIDAPFIALSAAGGADGQGRATVRLPAPGPDSRLVVVIDNTYLATIAQPPQDGTLETAIRIGPADTAGIPQVGSVAATGSLYVTVLTPRPAESAASRPNRLGKQSGRDPGFDPGDCGVQMAANAGRNVMEICRQNMEATVQVNLLSNLGLTSDNADLLADAIAAAMARYAKIGFVPAQLTAASPLRVVVQNASGDPQYSFKNGVVYLPADAANAAISGDNHDLLHELAHWIQDEEYIMALAAVSGPRSWWLETAAENMVMLLDQDYIGENLVTYGAATTSDNRLVLQQAPYQWPGNPGNFYVHAQLVRLNMCGDPAVCPLSEQSFKAAINQGTYPFADTGAQALLSANLDAYARYLLGAGPGQANTAMPVGAPVSSGDGYGEYIQVAQTTKSELDVFTNGVAPQVAVSPIEAGKQVAVAATIDRDGVYPLSLSSGVNGRNPGLPVALTVQPGAPFWYRVGSDAPQFHDGGEPLILAPIHKEMGLPGVRLVAVGKDEARTFKATIAPIDLQGTWLFTPGALVRDDVTCVTDSTSGESILDKEQLLLLPNIGGVMGDFRPDPAGNGLTWEWNLQRLPAEARPLAGSAFFYEGAVLPGPADIRVQAQFELAPQEGRAPGGSQQTLFSLALAALLPGAWFLRSKERRPLLVLTSLFLAAFMLAGCIGFGISLWGTIGADMQFNQIEYLGGEDVPVVSAEGSTAATPLWRLRGTADYDVDFTTVSTLYVDDQESTVQTHCTGTATYQVTAQIFKDAVINLE